MEAMFYSSGGEGGGDIHSKITVKHPNLLKQNKKNHKNVLCCFKIAKATLVITKPQHMY